MHRFAPRQASDIEQLHHVFLAILPRIEAHGQVYFRNVRCANTKEECLATTSADYPC